MRAGVHCATITIDPDDLAEGQGMTLDLGLAQYDSLWDPNAAPFAPRCRYAVRLLGQAACSFASLDTGAIVQPVRRLQSLDGVQAGERLRLRADLTRGHLGVYRNDLWCGLVHANVPSCSDHA